MSSNQNKTLRWLKLAITVAPITSVLLFFVNCTGGFKAPGTDSSASTGSHAQRPSFNTGNGFFVANGKLYDANGNEFRFRGLDRNHWDSSSQPGLSNSRANVVRTFIDFTRAPSDNLALIQSQNIGFNEVPMPTLASDFTSGAPTSCNTSTTVLSNAVATWVAQAQTWKTVDRYSIINIANEWGPGNSTIWRDSYISAIASLRAAGYLGTFIIDSGGCGQDDANLLQYAQAVFNSDPQKNVIFSIHLYGGVNDLSASIQSIAKGNPTIVTLASNSPTHPFAVTYDGTNNSYSGIPGYQITGVQGMTQINGMQPAPQNVGGTPGAWTVTLSVDSTNFGAYTSGGSMVDYYGNYNLRLARLAALAQQGIVVAIGEFGPGRNIGPSPTLVTPLQIITSAEKNNLGWIAWAFDDNDLAGDQTDNMWFGMTYGTGIYTKSSDLTLFGQQVIEGCTNSAPGGCGCPDTPAPALTVAFPGCMGTPTPQYQPYSLKSLAIPATIF